MADVKVLHGDARSVLRGLEPESVHAVVTSPPYYGLRKYEGVEPAVWGGYRWCAHEWGSEVPGDSKGNSGTPTDKNNRGEGYARGETRGQFCIRCDAWLGCLGLEPSVDLYLTHLLEVMDAVAWALRDDGVLFVNIGDSYAGSGKGGNGGPHSILKKDPILRQGFSAAPNKSSEAPAKSLLLVPEQFVVRMAHRGWLLRSKIVWAKRSAMPESVRDRPTSAHEPIYMFTKQGRYFWDWLAAREESKSGWNNSSFKSAHDIATKPGLGMGERTERPGRNIRNVWTDDPESDFWHLGPSPFKGAHFACVDEQTECLTVDGWKRHDQIQSGDQAAQFNIETGLLSWGRVEAVARYKVQDQEMVVGRCRDLSMVLTPNHRCVIQRRRSHITTLELLPPVIIDADSLLSSHHIPTSAPWKQGGIEPISSEWAELLGWYVAEGHESKQSGGVEIYQSDTANPEKVARIKFLLDAVEAEYSVAKATRNWRGREVSNVAFKIKGYTATYLRELAPGKRLPSNLLIWSDRLLWSLFDGLIAGDGHVRVDQRISFIQKDDRTANLVHAIAIRLGLSATITKAPSGTWRLYFTKHRTRTFRGTGGNRCGPLDRETYSGIVWCPKLPDGTWVARCDGRVFITGNTFPPSVPRRCILGATSEHGCCAACGAPYTRLVEPTEEYKAFLGKDWADYDKDAEEGRGHSVSDQRPQKRNAPSLTASYVTVGWKKSCQCDADVVPCTVLDPFAGSGTTGVVAKEMGRNAILIDASEVYCRMMEDRLNEAASAH